MNKTFARFLAFLVGVHALFFVMKFFLSADALIILLNGLFVGSLVGLIIAFAPLGWTAMRGRLRYADAGTFTLALFMLIYGIALGVSSSLWIRVSGLPVTPLTLTALARYAIIIGFTLFVYAPDFGNGLFYGRDRKEFALALAVGAVCSALVVYMQAYEVLA